MEGGHGAVSDYERQRLDNIRRNRERMLELGVGAAAKQVRHNVEKAEEQKVASTASRQKGAVRAAAKLASQVAQLPARRSSRTQSHKPKGFYAADGDEERGETRGTKRKTRHTLAEASGLELEKLLSRRRPELSRKVGEFSHVDNAIRLPFVCGASAAGVARTAGAATDDNDGDHNGDQWMPDWEDFDEDEPDWAEDMEEEGEAGGTEFEESKSAQRKRGKATESGQGEGMGDTLVEIAAQDGQGQGDVEKTAKEFERKQRTLDRRFATMVHKSHLVCLVARGCALDYAADCPWVQSLMISLAPHTHIQSLSTKPSKCTSLHLRPLIWWFHDRFKVARYVSDLEAAMHFATRPEGRLSMRAQLINCLKEGAGEADKLACLMAALLRGLGLTVRVVCVLDAYPVSAIVKQIERSAFPSGRDAGGSAKEVDDRRDKEREAEAMPPEACMYWVEVRCDGEGSRWVHADPVAGLVDSAGLVQNGVKRRFPLMYALAFAGGGAKDVTVKYVSRWSFVRKLRIPGERWWRELIGPLETIEKSRTDAELIDLDVGEVDGGNRNPDSQEANKECASAVTRSTRTDRSTRSAASSGKVRLSSEAAVSKVECKQECGDPADNQAGSSSAKQIVKLPTQSASSREAAEIKAKIALEPMPTNLESFKNHPYYVLEKLLKQYEVIHPRKVVGIFKGSLVFLRESVCAVHTRRRWLYLGRQVIDDEKPCKVVQQEYGMAQEKGKEDLNPATQTCGADTEGECKATREIELFGEWQTQAFDAPVATNGVVPKNERGQVDLFHQAMLPRGCRHLQHRGISRIAKELGIDYAHAFIGFERVRGRATPQFDGIVVCTEQSGLLEDAWNQQEREKLQKAEEKRRREEVKRRRREEREKQERARLESLYGEQPCEVPSERRDQEFAEAEVEEI
mmetsp:Transcript_10821/g.39683  ORF Transcript_10821/g.39683 Transcript_10821/m.39683 type:complete len:913 (+) Transcript_10821:131-2869(+)